MFWVSALWPQVSVGWIQIALAEPNEVCTNINFEKHFEITLESYLGNFENYRN